MTTTARKPKMDNEQRQQLLSYLITNNAMQFGRGDGHQDIAKAASIELGFDVKITAVQSNIAFLQKITALPFQLRKRNLLGGSQMIINRTWDKLDTMIRTSVSGRVTAEHWSLRTVQRFAKRLHKINIGLEPLAQVMKTRGYNVSADKPDEQIYIASTGAPK